MGKKDSKKSKSQDLPQLVLKPEQVDALEKELNQLELQIVENINDVATVIKLKLDKREILKQLGRL